jgi:hypothetical protein
VFAYEGPTVAGGPQQVYVSASSDQGRTWSAGTPISVAGEDATQPRLASFGGSTRLWYMQTTGGDNPDAWNVWYRSSADGGTTWTAPVKISDAPAGAAAYVAADGFAEVYGDYGEIGVTNTGKTVATLGRGLLVHGTGRHLVQHSRLSAAAARRPMRDTGWVTDNLEVQAARIPDRDRLLAELREAGLDARPVDEVGIEVRVGDEAEEVTHEVFAHVESVTMRIGTNFVPIKHEGVIYVRPPLS